MQRAIRAPVEAVEPNRMGEVVKTARHGHGRRGEDGGMHLRQPALRQCLTDIEALGAQALPTGLEAPIHLAGVDVSLVRSQDHELEGVEHLLKAPLAVRHICHELGLFLGDRLHERCEVLGGLIERVERGLRGLGEHAPCVALARGAANPHVRVVVGPIRTTERTRSRTASNSSAMARDARCVVAVAFAVSPMNSVAASDVARSRAILPSAPVRAPPKRSKIDRLSSAETVSAH